MKTNELMPGDWVTVTEDNNEFVGKVQAINAITNYCIVKVGGDWHGNEHDVFIEDMQPVPLTPDILKLNGWRVKKDWVQKGNFGDMPLLMWHTNEKPRLNHFFHELEAHDLSTDKGARLNVRCEYVHELQHALRYVGLDPNIEIICGEQNERSRHE